MPGSRLRLRWLSAVLSVLVISTGCTGTHGPSGRATPSGNPSSAPLAVARTIAWRGQTAQVNSRAATGYTLPAASIPTRRCHLSDLGVVPIGGGAAGTFVGRVSVHNRSTRACWLRGRPEIELIDKYGRIFQSTGPDPEHRPIRTVVLIPNSWANADLGGIASDICGGDQTTTLRISLPGQHSSRSLHFAVGRPPDPSDCGGRVVGVTPHPGGLAIGPFQSIPKPQDDFVLLEGLKTQLRLPAQVRQGATLVFAVEFTDNGPNSSTIPENPCPIFQMRLMPANVGGTYLLPCIPIIIMKAGQTVAFTMRLHVPATAPSGPATVRWQLREPEAPALQANTSISG